MSSPCRTTSLLVSKESDGRIAYNPREKEETLSLENEIQDLLHLFFLLPFVSLFLLFYSFSYFISHLLLFLFSFLFLFLFISPHYLLSLLLSLLLFESLYVLDKMRKFPPHLPQAKHVALPFSILFFYFIISSL